MRHLLVFICFILSSGISPSQAPRFSTSDKFITRQAVQGVAVDNKHFYTINSRGIGIYDKVTGQFVSEVKITESQIIHLDGGVVIKDKLYCAHSNYPGIPMKSSVEIFSTNDLKHVGSHDFGEKYGSCTWADFYRNSWWVCFAHYDQFRSSTGKGTEGTLLVRFDRNWHEKESWTFPTELISEVRPMSISGGSWGPDGNLYVSGHDSAKVYILKLPPAGSVLDYRGFAKIGSHGQGIAWDRSAKNKLYGIIRKENAVVVSELLSGK